MSRSRELSDEVKEAVRDALYACVENSDVWLEYGIIEYRFKSRYPNLYAELIEVYGHRELGDEEYPASNYLGTSLHVLSNRDRISKRRRSASGWFKTLGDVSHVARYGTHADAQTLTWVEFAERESIDPNVWTLHD